MKIKLWWDSLIYKSYCRWDRSNCYNFFYISLPRSYYFLASICYKNYTLFPTISPAFLSGPEKWFILKRNLSYLDLCSLKHKWIAWIVKIQYIAVARIRLNIESKNKSRDILSWYHISLSHILSLDLSTFVCIWCT